MKAKKKTPTAPSRTAPDTQGLAVVEANAAGIDVGASEHWVAVPSGRAENSVRTFSAYTQGLHELADWLKECGVTTVAMESTGVYWVPLYSLLEARGFRVCLVNARHVKTVPGRKSDVIDCQWLQKLHSYGLLRASFRPEASIVGLRTLLRHRENLMKNASAHVLHMQKALTLMNVQIHRAIADITGVTGMRIIRDIVAGNHDPEKLAEHRDHRCKADKKEIAEALRGEYQADQLFVLGQALGLYDGYQRMIAECDVEITRVLDALQRTAPEAEPPAPTKRRHKKTRAKEFLPDVRAPLFRLTGVDLTATVGLSDLTILQIIAEIGTDMSRWPTVHHFVSWATLAPGCRITGGKRFKSHRPPGAHRLAQILRMAAVSASKTETAIGAFYRRLAARKGAGVAVVATAAKLARVIYSMIKKRVPFADPGVEAFDARHRDRVLRSLKRRAAALGLQLVANPVESPTPTSEVALSEG